LKQQIPIFWFLVWPDQGSNPWSIALEVSMQPIEPLMWFVDLFKYSIKLVVLW
jgi:hypothetical protein